MMLHIFVLTLGAAGTVHGSSITGRGACLAGEACQQETDVSTLLQQSSGVAKSIDQSSDFDHGMIALNVTDAEYQAWLFGKIKKWLFGKDEEKGTLAPPFTQVEIDELVPKIACPFIAAVVKVAKIDPASDRTWTAAQAKRFFGDMVDPHVSGLKQGMANLFEAYIIKSFFGAAAALGFNKNAKSSLIVYPVETLHEIHSGIRLPEVIGKPDAWSKPCHSNSEEVWKSDPACGQPGPQPLVFDMLVKRLGEDRLDPEYKWKDGEIDKLCDEGRKVFYESGNQAYVNGGMPDGCAKLYSIGFKIFGELTTKEWKAFLIEATFPASFTAWQAFVPL